MTVLPESLRPQSIKDFTQKYSFREAERSLRGLGETPYPNYVTIMQTIDKHYSAPTQQEPSLSKETATEWLLPVVDFIIKPRMFSEYTTVKRNLLELFAFNRRLARSEDPERMPKSNHIDPRIELLEKVLVQLRFFPLEELNALKRSGDVDRVWQQFEEVNTIPFRTPREKILSLDQVAALSAQNPGRVALTAGRWRAFPHWEYGPFISDARKALGRDGILILGVESKESIVRRSENEPYILNDMERCLQMAEVQGVDYVFLIEPTSSQMSDYAEYFKGLWKKINPTMYVTGYQAHPISDRWEMRAKQLGIQYYWQRPFNTTSTSDILEAMRKKV